MSKTKTILSGTPVNMTRGREVQSVVKMAEDFLDGKEVDPNAGLYSEEEWAAMEQEYRDARKEGKKVAALPALYQPVVVQIAQSLNRPFLVRGNKGEKEDKFRKQHTNDVRGLVNAPEVNIRKVNTYEYVLGIHNLNAARSGCYRINNEVGIRWNFERLDVKSLVGQINNRVVTEKLEPRDSESEGMALVWLPNMRITWGRLYRDDIILHHDQIRKLEDGVGIHFEALKEPIRGRGIDEETWWNEVVQINPGADRMLGWNNLSQTQTRLTPNVPYCFGFRSVQIGIPSYTYFDKRDTDRMLVGFVIGRRLVDDLVQTKHDVNRLSDSNKPKVKPIKKEVVKKVKPIKKSKPKKSVTEAVVVSDITAVEPVDVTADMAVE